MDQSDIKYLRRSEIETDKWNSCIERSSNGLVYAHSEYLDALATNWDALVLNDYAAVMPLCWRKKFGVNYLYQPAFIQQLGVFNSVAGIDLTDQFLASIPVHFKYWDIQLNHLNHPKLIQPVSRKNYLLPLHLPYGEMKNFYRRSARRNILKAGYAALEVVEPLDPAILFSLHLERFNRVTGISNEEYASMEKLLRNWLAKGMATVLGVKDKTGKVIASSAYLIYKNRITFIVNGNTEESLENGATHFLKDHVIRKYSGKNWTMDFEGSDDPQFARFYEQYGTPVIENYPHIVCNKLPWPLKLFK
jgi:hypothetical protein